MNRVPISWMIVSLAVLAADRVTKTLVERLSITGWRRTVIPGFFDLVHTRNPGIAFGLLADSPLPWMRMALIGLSLVAAVAMAWLLVAGRAGGQRSRAGIALILGGAAGNLLDRLMDGGVVDFILIYFRGHEWPAFNVADSAIVVGAALVLLELLFARHPEPEQA
ncbi:MAG TPA: signal peptidase II [Candidatus Acidoferrales bacterium]|nr:signal peptidase II [Candidatus Acidoferrales bacterium]